MESSDRLHKLSLFSNSFFVHSSSFFSLMQVYLFHAFVFLIECVAKGAGRRPLAGWLAGPTSSSRDGRSSCINTHWLLALYVCLFLASTPSFTLSFCSTLSSFPLSGSYIESFPYRSSLLFPFPSPHVFSLLGHRGVSRVCVPSLAARVSLCYPMAQFPSALPWVFLYFLVRDIRLPQSLL